MRLMLSSFGAQNIDLASTADDALMKCKFDFYDIILCDFNLGAGKNGQQILEELRVRKRLKHTHLFIMITAETSKDVVLGTREYQPDAYIAKPVTRTVLEQRLGQLLTQQKQLKPINREIDLENHSKAISLCHEILEGSSRYRSWCYQTLAKLYTLIGDNASAEKIYRDVLNIRELPWARLGMGELLILEEQYDSAKSCFQEVVTSNPNMIEAYDGISTACMKLGQAREAQAALQSAVELSPRVVPRQVKLGNICLKNNDLSSASQAFRQAVNYGDNSIHEKPQNYLELGRCLADLSRGDISEQGKALAKEAISTMTAAEHKFSNDEDVCINSFLIESRVYYGQSKQKEAEDSLHKAESYIEEASISPEVGLEFAKTLYASDQTEKAEMLLIDLSKRFKDNKAVLSKIEALMDEPEDLETRLKAKDLNKQAISSVDAGQMDAAIEAFKAALDLTPKHAALILNFVQVLIKHFKDTELPELLETASSALNRLKHIPEQHHQYKRLQHFKKLIAKLSTEQA